MKTSCGKYADGSTLHGSTTVSDLGANSSKVWTFGTSGPSQRLTTSYEKRGASGTLLRTDYTWTADNGNVYVGSVLNTLNPGANPVQSKNTQSLDSTGNLTASAVYEYGNLVTPVRTYSYSYLTDVNYTNRWIQNRVTQVTMNGMVLVINTYDGYAVGLCSPVAGLTDRPGRALHDDTHFGSGFIYRGNVTSSYSVGGGQCMGYETTGVVTGTMDGTGRFITASPSSSTNYSLPGVLTPGGNPNLQTTMTYEPSWAVASLTGPNGASGTTTTPGHLTGVSMPRATGTQTRTFVYTGNDLTSATNPENGTEDRWLCRPAAA